MGGRSLYLSSGESPLATWIALLPIFALSLGVGLAGWITRDACDRGVRAVPAWVACAVLAGPIGLGLYLALRPSGLLSPCPWCGRRRLRGRQLCPHCSNA